MPKLFIVPTPIGNLEDISARSLRILKEAEVIFAEDTRTTGILLNHYGISSRMFPFYQNNEHKVLTKAIEMILSSESAALVSDAGTPGISDPGFLLIRECIKNDIEVECLPGPTALIPALVESGLPSDRFFFEGFLPMKKGRKSRMQWLAGLPVTVILYESPHKLLKTLEQLSLEFGPDRPASLSRELTKIHQETIRGTLSGLLAIFSAKTIRGEFVIVIGGKS